MHRHEQAEAYLVLDGTGCRHDWRDAANASCVCSLPLALPWPPCADSPALIARAQAMRDWLQTATGCNCETLDVCRLFDDGRLAEPPAADVALNITRVEAA